MYRKLGFIEVPIEEGVYKRSDIKMEIELTAVRPKQSLPGIT
jgi:hypothetical protein